MTPSALHPVKRQALRKQIIRRRCALSAEQRLQAGEDAARRLLALPELANAKHIAAFRTFGSEIATQPLIDALWRSGRCVYLPLLHPFSPGHLLFLRYTPSSKLVINRMHIAEPALDIRHVLPLEQLDVMVTPLLGFDYRGNRMGMGGGYYDRTLCRWRQYAFTPVGLALDCQQVPEIPVEAWDIPLPLLVTPTTTWRWASAINQSSIEQARPHRTGNSLHTQ